MTVIEEARAVLKKWRKGSTPGPWGISATSNELRAREPWNGFLLGTWANASGADQALIVGTAGNPDLLDAIDLGLAFYESETDIEQVPEVTALIATAILRADKEMQK